MTLLRYCKELYNIKKKLSDIFVLIQERDVWINTDVKQFLKIKESPHNIDVLTPFNPIYPRPFKGIS